MATSVVNKQRSSQLGSFLKLLRVKHYIKNALIFFPLFFSKRIFEMPLLLKTIGGFAAFSLIASVIYIINDIRDVEENRAHPTKCNRPIAYGAIKVSSAIITAVLLFVLAIVIHYMCVGLQWSGWALLLAYFGLNLGYSFGLKRIPLVDVTVLAAGFLLRMLYGSAITGIPLSAWLCLTTVVASFYLGFGKRRNEFNMDLDNKRQVLSAYSYAFLDKSMHMCMILALVFYSLWTLDVSNAPNAALIWTVPFLLLIVLKYNLNIEKNTDGDPTEVIFKDPVLLIMIALYAVTMFLTLYH